MTNRNNIKSAKQIANELELETIRENLKSIKEHNLMAKQTQPTEEFAPVHKISQIAPLDKAMKQVIPADNVLNLRMWLYDWKEVQASEKFQKIGNETYVVMTMKQEGEEDEIMVSTGSFVIKNQLDMIDKDLHLPAQVTIRTVPGKKSKFLDDWS